MLMCAYRVRGMSVEASALINGKKLSANQLEFIKVIIDCLTQRGVVSPGALYESVRSPIWLRTVLRACFSVEMWIVSPRLLKEVETNAMLKTEAA